MDAAGLLPKAASPQHPLRMGESPLAARMQYAGFFESSPLRGSQGFLISLRAVQPQAAQPADLSKAAAEGDGKNLRMWQVTSYSSMKSVGSSFVKGCSIPLTSSMVGVPLAGTLGASMAGTLTLPPTWA
jgi:hypothetical protein